MEFLKNLTSKQRQRFLIAVAIVVAIGLVVAITAGVEKVGTRPQEVAPPAERRLSLLTDKAKEDMWMAAEGLNVEALEKTTEELRAQIEGLQRQLEETRKAGREERPPPLPLTLPPPPPPVHVGPAAFPPQGIPPLPGEIPLAVEPVRPQRIGPPGASIKIFKDEVRAERDEEVQPERERVDQRTWLPSGSFMKAVLLSGIDAPTAGGAQAEPYPVLMGITDISVLPNRFRMNLRECFVIGAGYGNISDERAYIRAETLSCVRTDGKVIDVPLKGHVIGEDGKLGMRGRLVSKQGQQIAMAIFAGTLAGLGDALRPEQAVTIRLAPGADGGAIHPEFGDVMEGAALGGVGRALDRVAEHYLKMAERLFPIIEVDAGRHVEIIVLKGQELRVALR